MHELGRGARRPGTEVSCIDEGDGEALACRVRGSRSSDDTAADDEQIERPLRERLPRRFAGQSGFVHAFRPVWSTTSTRANGAVSGRSSRAAAMSPSDVASSTSAP